MEYLQITEEELKRAEDMNKILNSSEKRKKENKENKLNE